MFCSPNALLYRKIPKCPKTFGQDCSCTAVCWSLIVSDEMISPFIAIIVIVNFYIFYLFIYLFTIFFWHYHVVDVSALQFVGPSLLMPINIHFLFHFDVFVSHFTYFSTILLIIEVTLTNIFF